MLTDAISAPVHGDQAKMSALMKQYWDVKTQYPDILVFFRVGDFYELFDNDAQVASRELDITLTSRPEPGYASGRCPMAGVPARSVEAYLGRLLAKGYSVAVCEQIGVVGQEKGPIERQVTRILTPGTVLESNLLPARENNYLVSIFKSGQAWGLACVDASCGEFHVSQMNENQLLQELSRLSPKEVIVAKRTVKPGPDEVVPKDVLDIPEQAVGQYRFTGRPSMFFQLEPCKRRIEKLFSVETLEGFGCQELPLAISAAGAAIEYLQCTQGSLIPKFTGIATYSVDGHLMLDANTRRNLELTETSRERNFVGSLLWTIDQTATGMGSRALRKWLLSPLLDVNEITLRQDALQSLVSDVDKRAQIESLLINISDLERLAVKLSSATINPKELLSIADSIQALPALAEPLRGLTGPYYAGLSSLPKPIIDLAAQIACAIDSEAPREITEGAIFSTGFSSELDEIRSLLGGGKKWIEEFQKNEQERTGVRSLKVNFNRTFGYYIEVSHANQQAVPSDYIRKQTLTNAERFITPELKDYESRILNAEKNQSDLEYKLYIQLRSALVPYGADLLQLAQKLARLDALLALAKVACLRGYVRPEVNSSLTLEVKDGRHPVLETILPKGLYVANDTRLIGRSEENQLIVLTGPNMSGKSSLLRQLAHIVILAQMGSFVPATAACIGVVDRIFTRIGAVDDLSQGQSTFLVEMSETTQCCLSATERSLILLDEVGRGTSTYDGVAIAWSVAEFLATQVRARTIFATHYHELNGLASFFPQIANYQVMVKEAEGQVEFIHKVVPGGASRSFGVQVAKMAGLPAQVIERAQFLIAQMEKRSVAGKILDGPRVRYIPMDEVAQLSIFESSD